MRERLWVKACTATLLSVCLCVLRNFKVHKQFSKLKMHSSDLFHRMQFNFKAFDCYDYGVLPLYSFEVFYFLFFLKSSVTFLVLSTYNVICDQKTMYMCSWAVGEGERQADQ